MKDEKITIRIAEDEKELLKTISAQKDIPMSQLIREAIKLYIQEEERNERKNNLHTLGSI